MLNRFTWILVALFAIFGTTMVLYNRNANSDLKPFLGKWNGGYVVTSIGPITDPNILKGNKLDGYVVIYGAEHKFAMELSGPQQDINVTGTWRIVKATRLELKSNGVKIDDFGGADKRNPNLPYIPNEIVSKVFDQPFVLDLADGNQKFVGLLNKFGNLTGKYEFDRVGSGR
ncbi:hypothetical protein BH11ARM1_BH11ARM1_03930 [soil metagenome]